MFAPEDIQYYNAIANSSDCVLLPAGIRSRKVQWEVPRKSNGWAYGFGRANVWYTLVLDYYHPAVHYPNRVNYYALMAICDVARKKYGTPVWSEQNEKY